MMGLFPQDLLFCWMEMKFAISKHAHQFIDLTVDHSGLEDASNA